MTAKGGGKTRRDVLIGLAASSSLAVNPTVAKAQSAMALHEYAAQKAVALAAGREINLELLMPDGSGANVNPIIAAFFQATGITVRPIETPVDDINLQLTLDTLTGEGTYDLALPATFGLPDLANSGAIIPLTEYGAKHEPLGFRDGILYPTGDNFDGVTYGFQTDGDAYLMFYHKDLLQNSDEQKRFSDTYGYDLQAPLTWEQLDQQIAFFNRPDDGLAGGLLFRTPNYVAWEWWVRFHAKGIWPMSKDLVPQITGEAGVTALEDLIRVTENLPAETAQLGLFENWERYAKGDIYCNIGWGGTQKHLNGPTSRMRNRMVFGNTPGGLVDGKLLQTPYFNWGWNYVVSSHSPEPEIAYLFALFASGSEMSTLSVQQQAGYFDPFRPEHYNDPLVQKIYSSEFLEVHAHSMQNAIPDLYLAHQGEYFLALSEWLVRALQGDVSPEIALNRVAESWNLISVRSGLERQKERWLQLRGKYPQPLRSQLRDLS